MKTELIFLLAFTLSFCGGCSSASEEAGDVTPINFLVNDRVIYRLSAAKQATALPNGELILHVETKDSKPLADALNNEVGKEVTLKVNDDVLARGIWGAKDTNVSALTLRPVSMDSAIDLLRRVGVSLDDKRSVKDGARAQITEAETHPGAEFDRPGANAPKLELAYKKKVVFEMDAVETFYLVGDGFIVLSITEEDFQNLRVRLEGYKSKELSIRINDELLYEGEEVSLTESPVVGIKIKPVSLVPAARLLNNAGVKMRYRP